jgi:hypothetical protein
MQRIKKGSGKFRKILMGAGSGSRAKVFEIERLRVVRTFFELVDCTIIEREYLEILYSTWSLGYLNNRLRMFSFQFFNNSVSVGARTAARYRTVGNYIDQRCTFCVKSGMGVPHREDFKHLFIDCPAFMQVAKSVILALFEVNYDSNLENSRLIRTIGYVPDATAVQHFFNTLTSLFFNYLTWTYKLKRAIPSVATVLMDIDCLFAEAVNCRKLQNLALTCNSIVCRRWRSNGGRRG